MKWAHLHLILNHIPVVGIGFTILLFIIAIIKNNKELINISFIFVFITAIWAVFVYCRGFPAQDFLKDFVGSSDSLIKERVEKSVVALIFIQLTCLISLIAFILQKFYNRSLKLLNILILVLLIASGGFISWSANLGGKISHPEIRSEPKNYEDFKNNKGL